jgi:hypothetical protein
VRQVRLTKARQVRRYKMKAVGELTKNVRALMKYFTSRFTWLGSFLNMFHEKWELPAKSGMLLTFAVAALLMTGAAADADTRTRLR